MPNKGNKVKLLTPVIIMAALAAALFALPSCSTLPSTANSAISESGGESQLRSHVNSYTVLIGI